MEIIDKTGSIDEIIKYYRYNDIEIRIRADIIGYYIKVGDNINQDICETIYDFTAKENFDKAYKIAVEKFNHLTPISDKQKLLEYIEAEQKPTSARNLMGCSEDWYSPFYAIKQTFSKEEIEAMSDNEINNIFRIAAIIQEALY